MACDHIRIESFAKAQCLNDTMKEHGRLRHFGLFQLFIGSGKHDISNLKAENFISLIKKLLCKSITFI